MSNTTSPINPANCGNGNQTNLEASKLSKEFVEQAHGEFCKKSWVNGIVAASVTKDEKENWCIRISGVKEVLNTLGGEFEFQGKKIRLLKREVPQHIVSSYKDTTVESTGEQLICPVHWKIDENTGKPLPAKKPVRQTKK